MSAKYTPGPWLLYDSNPMVIVNGEGSSLGEMLPGDPFITPREALANATLVAAAPHMASAIRDFLHALDRGYLACKDDSAFIDDLRAALAEAGAS